VTALCAPEGRQKLKKDTENGVKFSPFKKNFFKNFQKPDFFWRENLT
jgi:hypothetical protein